MVSLTNKKTQNCEWDWQDPTLAEKADPQSTLKKIFYCIFLLYTYCMPYLQSTLICLYILRGQYCVNGILNEAIRLFSFFLLQKPWLRKELFLIVLSKVLIAWLCLYMNGWITRGATEILSLYILILYVPEVLAHSILYLTT